jgi:hypothetical protein
MITMSLSEHRDLPKVFVDVWTLYQNERFQHEEELKAKKK